MTRRLIVHLCAAAATALLLAVPLRAVDRPASSRTAQPRVARTVLALYDGNVVDGPRFTTVHVLAEMPLNYLGLVVRYHDIRKGLPPLSQLGDVRGVLTWFASDALPAPLDYLRWLREVSQSGKRVVIVGNIGALSDERGNKTPLDEVNRTLAMFGWRFDGGWNTTTTGSYYKVKDDGLIGFERPLSNVVPPYATVRATTPDTRVGLRVATRGRLTPESDLILVSPRGGYVAPGFAFYTDRSGDREFRQWYLNPFEFFRQALGTDDLPKADAATVSGRRIYYSHIDGDGWRSLTQIEPYRTRYVMAARVVLDEIVRKFDDLPVSVAPIIGDIDPAWKGSAESLAVARDFFAQSQVEPAIHTYSHPLDWRFFDSSAAGRTHKTTQSELDGLSGPDVLTELGAHKEPRSYDTRPFTLGLEFDDAAAFVNRMLPPGKKVGLVQWSGDTRPFEAVLAHVRRIGMANINGGDTRFDREFPSAAWVAPLANQVGPELQVYASNSNENTYTDLWRSRFFGFSFLERTVRNTETPRRLKPFNLYYHMYSGERLSSLNAVLANLRFARQQRLAPIEASRFSRIVQGFYSVAFDQQAPRSWRVRNRGALQTVRFDAANTEGIDFVHSHGVIGQRHDQGSLYVTLDESADEPLIVLKSVPPTSSEPVEGVPYLVDARWRVHDVRVAGTGLRFVAEGYGPGEFTWIWPHGSRAQVTWRAASGRSGAFEADRDAAGRLSIRLPQLTAERVDVAFESVGGSRAGSH